MIIMLFGVSNVGKTATGAILAEKLSYSFYDLDEEIKKKFQVTLEEFMRQNPWPYDRCKVKGAVLKEIVQKSEDNAVIAVSPIYYARNFNSLLELDHVVPIELQDSAEHIFKRLVFSDENDNIYEDNEYKEEHKDYYLKDIREDIAYARQTFKRIKWKYSVDNKPVEQVADELYEMLRGLNKS
ncbi:MULTISPECIES: shikimate kinase [unclassified Adlercreutzia]|uniref:shikimate kinase n=1 Tax=unclassified Adlercreutzia TaxID=2636013 RepID=UPI0013EC4A47|nr:MULTISPECIES: shikimate kinase [unclassified Adlercreutzia]